MSEIKRIWVVTKPTIGSKIEGICFEVDTGRLADLFNEYKDIKLFHQEEEAKALASKLIVLANIHNIIDRESSDIREITIEFRSKPTQSIKIK